MKAAFHLREVCKTYNTGSLRVHALTGINLVIKQGDYVSIMGPSGSGKSSLLNILGLLDQRDSGELSLLGRNISAVSNDLSSRIRNRHIGFVFQDFNLLPHKTALDNVALPLVYRNERLKNRREKAKALLARVGLEGRSKHLPSELSGGQQQKVGVARALASNPEIILADEPTGALDSESTQQIMSIFDDINKQGKTVIIVTHDREIAEHTNRKILFKNGNIVADTQANTV